MRKKLLILCSILLIIGCSKAEPKQEEELTVKSVTYTETIPVTKVQEEEKVVKVVEPEVEEVLTPVVPPKEKAKPVYKKKAITKPKVVPLVDVPAEEIDKVIEEDVQEKIKIDEEITKAVIPVKKEEPVEEKEKKSPIIWIVLAVAAVAGIGGAMFFKKKPPIDEDEV